MAKAKQQRSLIFVVQSLSCVWLFATTRTAAHQILLSFTISQRFLKLTSIESVKPSNHLSSVTPFSSSCQPFPTSESFPRSQLFTSGAQSIGASASASVLLVNIQGMLVWLVLSPCCPRGSEEFSPAPKFKGSIIWRSVFFVVQLSHS